MPRYAVPVVWTEYATMYIDADCKEDAIKIAYEEGLPDESDYLDGSFEVETSEISATDKHTFDEKHQLTLDNMKVYSLYSYLEFIGYGPEHFGRVDDFNSLRDMIEELELWDYPLEEITHCIMEGIPVVVVQDSAYPFEKRLFEF